MEAQKIPSITLNGGGDIGDYAFYHCYKAATITIGDKVKSIGVNAFSNSAISSVTIPDSVTSLKSAFNGCEKLTSMIVGNGLTLINANAFRFIENLTDFTIASPIPSSISFAESTKLTIDSLKNIINALVDYSGTENEGVNTLTLNSTCNATLDAEGATAPDGLTWKEYVAAKGWLLA